MNRYLEEGKKQFLAKNYTAAIPYFEQAANSGITGAMINLGMIYSKGLGVKIDFNKGIYYYLEAVSAGNTFGLVCLANMYRTDIKDYNLAEAFFRLAIDKGDRFAMTGLAELYSIDYNNDIVAMSWYRKAAEAGEPMAMVRLGKRYENGRNVEKDYTVALSWYRKAAEAGNGDGMCALGYMYERGLGVPKNLILAHVWYQKAVESGFPNAIERLNEERKINIEFSQTKVIQDFPSDDILYQSNKQSRIPKKCVKCSGTGKETCYICKGRGERERDVYRHNTFVRVDMVKCDKCYGKGKIECEYCNGTGMSPYQ